MDAEAGRDGAAAGLARDVGVRLFCSTYGGTVVGVRVNEHSFIVITN